ncbi:PREDICTED: protein SMAX1-LIKE 2 [Tarenaya hassleriana]|uniref:protein SMAX1-LIKE 2 n=1 Tax=Tarenaya hassleriana TaxID=28532 RepID=UPI00053C59D3|nr:PREDICTED: protein SMAX1-LIKE 2 [Tarenaya hassleriana]
MRTDLGTIQQTLTPDAASVLNQSIAEATRRNHGQTTPLHVATTLLASPSGFLRQRPQPLLAVKVELEQLIVSILDDPSVSRVMREASFSSPAVKSAIEQSLGNSNSSGPFNQGPIGFGYRPVSGPITRNLYLNPRLQQPGVAQTRLLQSTDEVKRVLDIMVRTRKRNPVLVGESEPQNLGKEILGKIESGEICVGSLRNSQVIHVEKELALEKAQMATRVKEISVLVETRMGNSDLECIVLDLGDLKWLVEQQHPPAISGGGAVAEMGKLLERYGGRLWFIGTATCETYLRCQVYYPSMDNDWDLQAIPIAAKSPIFPRQSPMESVSPARSFQIPAITLQPKSVSESLDSVERMRCCPQCLQNYRTEVGKQETERTPLLPQWLQKPTKDQELSELGKKWNETCLRLHPRYHRQPNMTTTASEKILPLPVSPLKLQNRGNPSENTLQMNFSTDRTPPESPLGTDLVLGRPNGALSSPDKTRESYTNGGPRKDSEMQEDSSDIDSFKKLLKGLAETVWWQHDAASAVAGTISRHNHGDRKPRGVWSKRNDIWLLFTGPDRVGKNKMVSRLSDLISGSQPITISLGVRRGDEATGLSFRGKTTLDRITDTVRKNPSAVIVIEDMDEADAILRGNIKRAMERGRISDSYGREISLGNVVVILTTNWSPESLSERFDPIDETKLEGLVSKGWQLRFSVSSKTLKRRPSWLYNNDDDNHEKPCRPRKEISFDLNEAAEIDEEKVGNGSSTNSSDVTTDHDQEDNFGLFHKLSLPPHSGLSIFGELGALVDDAIFFRPVDFDIIKRKTAESLKNRFSGILGENQSKLEIEETALERISGAIWIGEISLEEWIEEAMVPSLNRMKSRVSSSEESVFKLELDDGLSDRVTGDYLPRSIRTLLD